MASHSQWSKKRLIASATLATALIGSWLLPATRGVWDRWDIVVFRTLNNTLQHEAWQTIWAVGNWRPFDFIPGLLLFVLLILAIRPVESARTWSGWSSLAVLALGIVVTKWLFSELLLNRLLGYHRPSPTMTLENCYRLSELAPWIEAKDASSWCFPGDHGFVLFAVALYLTWRSNRTIATLAWLAAAVFVLPRMAAGAHWSTDILVGSASMAFVCVSLILATPLHDWATGRISNLATRRLWDRAGIPECSTADKL